MDDFDIEMGDAVDVPMEEPQIADILIGDDLQEDGEIDEPTDGGPTDNNDHRVVLNKVHIRGLDQIDQDQLKAYVVSHVGGKGADRVEWVNDTSANLVFSTEPAAHEALLALSAIEIADATQLSPGEVLAAKPIANRPEVALQVRYALESDKKERGAAQKSRFYLFHPEWDPETDEGRRKRDRQYRDRRDGDRHRRGGRSRREERDDEEPEPFDVNLYDDNAGALARRTRDSPRRDDRRQRRDSRSRSAHSRDGRRHSINRDKELFPNSRSRDALHSDRGSYGRGRSASPTRDDRDAIEADLARDREAVRNNREKARSIKERIYTSSKTKELFPTDGSRELFPSAGEKKELFPDRDNGVSRAAMDQVPNDVLEVRTPKGALSARPQARQNSQGIMTIKGTAKSVKELFPNKFNDKNSNPQNAGKELFADRSDGRTRRRQRAGDLFD